MIGRTLLALIFVMIAAAYGQGENSKATRLLPRVSDLKGWREVEGSYQYGAGEGLTAIYDGGYRMYVDAGVVEAAQKLFRKDKLYLTITTHTMRSANSASTFLQHWEKANEKRDHTPGRGKGFIATTGGATNVYWVQGGYFVTIMVTGSDASAKREALSALSVVAKRVPAPVK